MRKSYWVYILGSKSGTLYTGVTNDPLRRIAEHRDGTGSKFSRRYKLKKVLLLEEYGNIHEAIAREKQIKGWKRLKKLALIEGTNPKFEDLAVDWY